MGRVYYHATTESNMYNILIDGVIRHSLEGIVYCCTSPEDCLKFASIRILGSDERVAIMKISVPEDVEVQETFDHSETFFKCKSYGIQGDVPISWIDIDSIRVYELNMKNRED